ncbi:MAG: hypothetical protein AB1512_04135 [Thermodesulfobacteriota bacterium]
MLAKFISIRNIWTSNGLKMGLRHLPMVFTEQGVAMSTPLNAVLI